jgi:purine-binding chemotaxis protein CheW
MEIIVFEIDGRRYALRLPEVREILRSVAVTPLPGAPVVVEGVVDVRGTLTAVLSLRRRFGLPARENELTEHLLHVSAGGRTMLLRTDRVLDILRVEPADVQSALEVVSRAEPVAGIARLPDGLALIHDFDAFLTQAESEELDRVLTSAAAATGEAS